MRCLTLEQIYLYIEEELTGSENKKIEEHLIACPKCTKAFEERKLLHQAAEDLPLWQTPPDFTRQTMARIFPAKVSLRAWLGAGATGFASTMLAFLFFWLATGHNISDLLIDFNHTLWNFVKNISLIFVKLFKLASIIIKLLQQFFGFLLKAVVWVTTLINPQIQIIIITIIIILTVSFAYGIKRKIHIGEKA